MAKASDAATTVGRILKYIGNLADYNKITVGGQKLGALDKRATDVWKMISNLQHLSVEDATTLQSAISTAGFSEAKATWLEEKVDAVMGSSKALTTAQNREQQYCESIHNYLLEK